MFGREEIPMKRRYSMMWAAWVSLAAIVCGATSQAVEIPDGIEANLQMGDFKDNEYVDLKTVYVEPWLDSEEDGEQTLVTVELDYQPPDYDDEPPEVVSIAFGVWDSKKKDLITKAMGGAVKSSGPFEFKWDLLDEDGNKVPDGIYRVVMNITGEHYGDLLRNAAFPIYITSGAPTLEGGAISSRQGVLEYGGAPEIRFATTNINNVAAITYDSDENEIGRWEDVLGPGKHMLKSDLKDNDSNPLTPGKYATRVVLSNPFGPDQDFIVRFTLHEPEPLELSVKMNAGKEMLVDEKTTIPFNVTVNQNAYVTIEHLSDGGAKNYIGKSNAEKPAFLLAKGSHDAQWNRRPTPDSTSHYTKGTHWIRVTAATLTGEKMVVDTHKITLQAKPQAPKRAPEITLTLSPDYVVIGGRMRTTIEYSLDLDARVRLALYDSSSGQLLKDLVYKNTKKGRYSMDLGVSNLEEGNYKIVLRVQNNHGHRELSRILSVGWRR